MTEKNNAQADEAPGEIAHSLPVTQIKHSKAYSSIRRNLSEKELLNIGSVNLLIDDIERMSGEIAEFHTLRDKYHAIDRKHAVLSEKLAAYKLNEISYNVSISLGALLVGSAKSLWEVEYFGVVALVGGLALWLTGSAMKFGRMFVK